MTYSHDALGGLGMEVAYALRPGLALFVAGDVQSPEGTSELAFYGALSLGVHLRRPLSRRFVPRADVAVERVFTIMTAVFVGAGGELFFSRHLALNGALHFGFPLGSGEPVDKNPRRTLVGLSWYLGPRGPSPAPRNYGVR